MSIVLNEENFEEFQNNNSFDAQQHHDEDSLIKVLSSSSLRPTFSGSHNDASGTEGHNNGKGTVHVTQSSHSARSGAGSAFAGRTISDAKAVRDGLKSISFSGIDSKPPTPPPAGTASGTAAAILAAAASSMASSAAEDSRRDDAAVGADGRNVASSLAGDAHEAQRDGQKAPAMGEGGGGTHDSAPLTQSEAAMAAVAGSPKGLSAVKQLADALHTVSTDHSEYCDILHRNLEDNVLAALSSLREQRRQDARYDVHLHGQRSWLTEEARMWLAEDLPARLERISEALGKVGEARLQSWGNELSFEAVTVEETQRRDEAQHVTEGILQENLKRNIKFFEEQCTLKMIQFMEDEVRKKGFKGFKFDSSLRIPSSEVDVLIAPVDVMPAPSTSLPDIVTSTVRELLRGPIRDCTVIADDAARRLATGRAATVLGRACSDEYKPTFALEMEAMATNPNAVKDAVEAVVVRCHQTVASIRRELTGIIGAVGRSGSPTVGGGIGVGGIASSPSPSRPNGHGAADHSSAPSFASSPPQTTLLEEARERQRASMAELVTQWRAAVDRMVAERARTLGAYREIHGSAMSGYSGEADGADTFRFLQRFAEEMGEPLVELPAGLDASTAPIEVVAALRYIGGPDSDFCLFLELSDLDVMLDESIAPLPGVGVNRSGGGPSSSFWGDLLARYKRLKARQQQQRGGGGSAAMDGMRAGADDGDMLDPHSKSNEAIRRWQLERNEETAAKEVTDAQRRGILKAGGRPPSPSPSSRIGGQGKKASQRYRDDYDPRNLLKGAAADAEDGDYLGDMAAVDPFLAAITYGYSKGELAALQELRRLRARPAGGAAGRSHSPALGGGGRPAVGGGGTWAHQMGALAPMSNLQRVIALQEQGQQRTSGPIASSSANDYSSSSVYRSGSLSPRPAAREPPMPTPLRSARGNANITPTRARTPASRRGGGAPAGTGGAGTFSTARRATTPTANMNSTTAMRSGTHATSGHARRPTSTAAAVSPLPARPATSTPVAGGRVGGGIAAMRR